MRCAPPRPYRSRFSSKAFAFFKRFFFSFGFYCFGSFMEQFAEILAFTSNDIKVGSSIEVDGAPWKVLGTVL